MTIIINDKDNNLLILVNKENPIKENYDLNLRVYKNKYVAKELVKPLKKLEKVLKRNHISFELGDTYVSIKYQKKLFNNSIKSLVKKGFTMKEAKLKTAESILLPRYSEHHTGLAIDFVGEKSLYDWLEKNAYQYGFILRYPKNKENSTKYNYDKTHYRYVGIDAAKIIQQKNLSLEEYLKIYKGEEDLHGNIKS